MNDLTALLGSSVLLVGKGFVIVFLCLYLVFSFVLVKQVNLMTRTLELGLEDVLKIFSYLHLLFALGLLFISIVIL